MLYDSSFVDICTSSPFYFEWWLLGIITHFVMWNLRTARDRLHFSKLENGIRLSAKVLKYKFFKKKKNFITSQKKKKKICACVINHNSCKLQCRHICMVILHIFENHWFCVCVCVAVLAILIGSLTSFRFILWGWIAWNEIESIDGNRKAGASRRSPE